MSDTYRIHKAVYNSPESAAIDKLLDPVCPRCGKPFEKPDYDSTYAYWCTCDTPEPVGWRCPSCKRVYAPGVEDLEAASLEKDVIDTIRSEVLYARDNPFVIDLVPHVMWLLGRLDLLKGDNDKGDVPDLPRADAAEGDRHGAA